jgi:hypothetical protein
MKIIPVVLVIYFTIYNTSALHLRVPTGYDNFPIDNDEKTNVIAPFEVEGIKKDELPSVLIRENDIQLGALRFAEISSSSESSEGSQAALDQLYNQALNLINQRNSNSKEAVQTFKRKEEGIVLLDSQSRVMIDDEIYTVEEIKKLVKFKRDFERNKRRV